MAKKKKGREPQWLTTPPPTTLDEAAEYIRLIGEAERAIIRHNTELNDAIALLTKGHAATIEGFVRQYQTLGARLYEYAKANRKALTNDGETKTIILPTGSFSWRMTPKSVDIKKPKEIIALLKALKLERFIRTKEEPDKEAMLKEEEVAAAVEGVSISQRENFTIKPAEVNAEVAVSLTKTGKLSLKLVFPDATAKKPKKKKAA